MGSNLAYLGLGLGLVAAVLLSMAAARYPRLQSEIRTRDLNP